MYTMPTASWFINARWIQPKGTVRWICPASPQGYIISSLPLRIRISLRPIRSSKRNNLNHSPPFPMKHLLTLLLGLVLVGQPLSAQQVPNGMKYQAVARDMQGRVLANQDLQLRITLYADPRKQVLDYIEIHKVFTN